MTATFEGYHPLVESERQIRLLTVHAGWPAKVEGSEDIVACTLETMALRHANPFYALSYVWGPLEPMGLISINGQIIHVRRNLWLFLLGLRERFCHKTSIKSPSEHSLIRVWVDYICIQQCDIRERNFQVSMMGDIYKAAEAIYAWLGESEAPIDGGMQCIAETARLRERHIPWIRIRREVGNVEERLRNLSASSYWTRMWIKQEAILAKDLWFFYGESVAHWQDMAFVTRLCPRTRTNQQSQSVSFRSMLSLLDARSEQSVTSELPDLMQRFGDAKCQDPRDRIYALLALIDQRTSQQIVVDYQKPVLQVLLENYHLWTQDHSPAPAKARSNLHTRVYQLGVFCTSIHRILPQEDFEALYRSKSARQEITAMGTFIASDISAIELICPIATIDRTAVHPVAPDHSTETADDYAFVLRTSLRPYQSRKVARARQCFIYSNVLPGLDSLVVRIGSRVLFLRVAERFPESQDEKGESHWHLIGTGTEARDVDHIRLSRQLLPHPCLWLSRQLDDADFVIHSSSNRFSLSDVYFTCNAAAMIMLLDDFRKDRDTSSQNHGGNSFPLSRASDGQQFERWSPYTFGLNNKLLHPCMECKIAGRGAGLSKNTSSGRFTSSSLPCECTWIGHDKS